MPVIKNRQLDSVGINTDLHPTELPVSGFTDGLNVRFDKGAVVTRHADGATMTGNDHATFGPPLNLISTALEITQGSSFQDLWIYGTVNKLWLWGIGQEHVDVARLVGDPLTKDTYNNSTYWEFTPFGSTVIAVNESNIPQIKVKPVGGMPKFDNFIDMPGWGVENVANDPNAPPVNWSTPVIRSYGEFLIAIGMQEAPNLPIHKGGSYPQRVRWSSTAQPGQAPASWNGATLQTNAGWNDLSGVTGRLIDGAVYQDKLILFTENEAVEMRFVGGNAIFNFRKLFDDGGLLARNCAVEFHGRQFCIGPNDVYVHDTSSKESVASDQIKDRLFSEIGSTDTQNVRVFHHELQEEIWVMYSSTVEGSGVGPFPLDRAAIWNYASTTWSFITLKDASGIAQGITPGANVTALIQWDELGDLSWKDTILPWSGSQSGFGNNSIVYSSFDGGFYLADEIKISNGLHPERFIEKIGIDLSEIADGTTDRWIQLTRIIPTITSSGTGRIKVIVSGSKSQQSYPDWNATSNDVYEFLVDEDSYKLDVRQSWSFLAIRIEFMDDVPYEVHTLDMEVNSRGRR